MRSRLPYRFFPFFFILYVFSCNLSNDLYLPALPNIAREFSIDIHSVGLTIAAWLAGDACLQWLLGPLTERYGRRNVLFAGGLFFSLSTLICAFTTDFSMLLLARFVQGIGVCSMMIAGYASIHETYADKQAVTILAWITSISIIAPMIGPLLGGLLLMWVDWRWLFLIIQFFATIALIGLWFWMPNNQNLNKSALNPRLIWKDYRQLLKNKIFILRSGTLGLIYASLIAWITGSPDILMNEYHLSTLEFGLSQSPIFGCYIIGTILGQRLMNKQEGSTIIRYGISLSILGVLCLLASIMIIPSQLWGIMVSMSIITLGAGLNCAPLNRACFQSSNVNKGITSALFYTILMGTGTLWSVLVSLKFANGALSYLSILVAIAIALSWLSYKRSHVTQSV